MNLQQQQNYFKITSKYYLTETRANMAQTHGCCQFSLMQLSTSLKGGIGTMACRKKMSCNIKYALNDSQVFFCLSGCFYTTEGKYKFCLVSLHCGIIMLCYHLPVVSLHCGINSLAYHTLYYPISVVPLQCCPTCQSY